VAEGSAESRVRRANNGPGALGQARPHERSASVSAGHPISGNTPYLHLPAMPNVLPRSSSLAAVLDGLAEVKEHLEREENRNRTRPQQAAPLPPAQRAAPRSLSLLDVALLGVALAVSAALVLGWTRESAVALPACLASFALALLGVGHVAHAFAQAQILKSIHHSILYSAVI